VLESVETNGDTTAGNTQTNSYNSVF